MHVLVAYASRHGATRGIAERIALTLQNAGLQVTCRPVGEVERIDGYDAFVIGSAAYMYHWLKEASLFVRRHRAVLGSRPVWLFSSGPLGTAEVAPDGRDVRVSAMPKGLAELAIDVHARDERVFFGAYDPGAPPIGLAERLMRLMPAGREALPTGDFRDWAEIEAWAAGIARDLQPVAPGSTR